MKKKVDEILGLLEENDDQTNREILIECISRIGTKEWADDVKDLWKRMKDLEKKK